MTPTATIVHTVADEKAATLDVTILYSRAIGGLLQVSALFITTFPNVDASAFPTVRLGMAQAVEERQFA
jgi:hypothetical protein